MSSKIVESKNPVIQPLSSILFGPGVGAKYLASMVYCGYTCKKITSKIIHVKNCRFILLYFAMNFNLVIYRYVPTKIFIKF